MNKKSYLKLTVLNARLFLSLLLLSAVTSCTDKSELQEKVSTQKAADTSSSDVAEQWATVKLPVFTEKPIQLRVANVVNARFKQLTKSQIDQILLRSRQLVKQHFNLEIVFSSVETIAIEAVFNRLDAKVKEIRKREIVNLNLIDDSTREGMQQALFKMLSNYSGNKQNVIDFAQPFLLAPDDKQKDFIGLSYALVDTLIARLSYWKNQSALDGKPVLNSDEYHEWVWWDSLGYSDLTYDVMITNQLVANAEYYAMDVHSSIRGGITAGTTTYNKNTALNTYVYIMVYPMLNDTDLLTMLRSDESYTEEQIINYSAALLTHELGHMLLHLGHPFGNNHCIMAPTVMLNYRQWYDNLDAALCPVGSSGEMTPGVARIDYNMFW